MRNLRYNRHSALILNTNSELLPETPLNTIGESDGDMYIQYVISNWLDGFQEFLKENHPGSANHPNGCRVCVFQSGLCWKGMACEYCHICSKPPRKSKHQRDVEKRREERYAASSSAAAATESLAFSPFPGVNLGLTPNERMKLEHAEKLARIIQLKTELEKEQNALRSIAEMIDTDNPF